MALDRLARTSLALLGLVLVAHAQAEPGLRRARTTPVKHMAYDWANQRVVRQGTPGKRFVASFCYVNTDTTGFFTSTTLGTEFIDWGVLGGTATTKCVGLSDIVASFRFAYATAALDTSVAGPGAALALTYYTDWKGFGLDSGNCPVATFAFSGMPGFSGTSTGIGAAYAFSVDLSGGFEFCLSDGRFGYGYRGDGKTGPLSCFTSDDLWDGSPEACTGNDQHFDVWLPDTKGVALTPFFFGPPYNIFSWYGQIARADLSGSPAAVALRNGAPNAAGSLVCTIAPLGGTFSLTAVDPTGHTVAFAFAFDTPVSILLGGGQRLLCNDLGGNGELLTGGGLGLSPIGPSAWSSGLLPVPKNLDLCGFAPSVQAIFAFGVLPFALSSACDLTLGG